MTLRVVDAEMKEATPDLNIHWFNASCQRAYFSGVCNSHWRMEYCFSLGIQKNAGDVEYIRWLVVDLTEFETPLPKSFTRVFFSNRRLNVKFKRNLEGRYRDILRWSPYGYKYRKNWTIFSDVQPLSVEVEAPLKCMQFHVILVSII